MKRFWILLVVATLAMANVASAQIFVKVNALYALAGVINPQVEGVIAPHSTLSIDATYSPWKSIKGKHAEFCIFQGEYRYYFRQAARGWYVSVNAGMTGFDINKPQFFKNGLISFKKEYGKGFGFMIGAGAGYQHTFRERWVVDAFIAFDFLRSWYNGYNANGEIVMNPQGHEHYKHPDPFNGSAECVPKVGVSLGYRIFDPARHRKEK
jgi:opacity protein-like surface antigen